MPMMCLFGCTPHLWIHFVNMNTYIKFGEIMSNCSQDIKLKQNVGVNQGS